MYTKRLVHCLIVTIILKQTTSLEVLNLNSNASDVTWSLENSNGSIKVQGSVPGGVYSDLHNAGIIGDIFASFNDVLTRWIAYDTWIYSVKFNVDKKDLQKRTANLVLHGVDTVSYIDLNGSPVGTTDNMFVRYVFDVKQYLQEGLNELNITFESPVTAANIRSKQYYTPPQCVPGIYNGECHANQLRKMQASFGWDWGPAFPSVGLWKSAEIEFYNSCIIRTVTINTTHQEQRWIITAKLHLETEKRANLTGQLQAVLYVTKDNYLRVDKNVNVRTSKDGGAEAEITISVSENVISLWWPNGFGDQPLYELHVNFISSDNPEEEPATKVLKIGFRTIELVEEDPAAILGNTTAATGLSFYFKVNGYPLFMKGSNWIPSHILPEFSNEKETIDNLLGAVHETHMAMIRVWGGGIYEPDYFYQRCDELGILVWQDLLFACSMYPVDGQFLRTVATEVEQNVKRLQHHPSIAVWAGNNENEGALRDNWYGTAHDFDRYKSEYIKLYVDTIKPIVEAIDPGRRYLVSSPSNGIQSEREGYIAERPSDPHYGDTHYYNYLTDNWDQNTYPFTRFASEYGFQSLPSMATMRRATNNSEDYKIDSEYSVHRQHSPAGYIAIQNLFLRHLKLEESDPNYFEKFVFYSQISQAMAIKAETEFYRQSQYDWYTMGALYWQLNDVWQAPSWSGIEFGGKWKMLHYFAKSFFAPVLVSPRRLSSGDVDVYLINDRFVPIENAEIVVDFFKWDSISPFNTQTFGAKVEALSSQKQDISLNAWKYSHNETLFMRFSIKAEGVYGSPNNYVFPVALKNIKGLKKPNIQINVSSRTLKRDNLFRYPVDIQVDCVVLFLWLETELDGRFEDNGMIVTQTFIRTFFRTTKQYSAKDLEKSITYQYYLN